MSCHKDSVWKVAIRVEKNKYSEDGLTFRKVNMIPFLPLLTGKLAGMNSFN